MLYLLHHSKGALVLSAEDRHQVVEWSKRQLGLATNSSIMKSIALNIESSVERSGTGVNSTDLQGCKPMLSMMANSASGITEWRQDATSDMELSIDIHSATREVIWH